MEGNNRRTKGFKWASVLLFAVLMIAGCKQAQGNSGSSGKDNKKPDTPAAPSTGDFIMITPPAAGITGKAPAYPLPGAERFRKGVFIKNRTVKLTPYMMGKTEVTYEL